MNDLGSMTWRGLGLDTIDVRIGLIHECAVFFGTLSVTLLLWEGDRPFYSSRGLIYSPPASEHFLCPVQIQRTQSFSPARRADCNLVRGGLIYEDRFPKS
jgi:hypothetical protein